MRFSIILIPLSLLLFSCTNNEIFFTIKYSKNRELSLSFLSKKDTLLVVDSKAFSYNCYNKEKKDLIMSFNENIDSIACNIEYSQAILIDQNGNMRFFTDYFALPNEVKVVSNVNCMEDWHIKLDLKEGKPETILIDDLYTSDLMVTETSSKIKIIYLQKIIESNGIRKCANIVESNWIKVN